MPANAIMRVLIRRSRAYGDVFWIEPLASEIAASGHQVAVSTKAPDLIENVPGVALNPRCFRADRTIDLDWSYESNPRKHILAAYSDVCRDIVPNVRLRYPRLYFAPGEFCDFTPEVKGPYAVFDLRYAHYSRNYRRVHNVDWTEVLDYVKESLGLAVVRLSDGLSLEGFVPGTPRLRDTIPWIQSSALFVGVDSAPSHIAAALGKPAVILFGAVNPWYRHLPGFSGVALQNPCVHAGCYHSVLRRSRADALPICALVGNSGNPPCCTFTTRQVIESIEQLNRDKAGGSGTNSDCRT